MKYLYAFVIAITALILCSTCQWSNRKPVKYIVYVGFNYHSQPAKPNPGGSDTLNITLLGEYIARMNDSGKYRVRFDTIVYECNFDANLVEGIYKKIADNPDVALVIDNTWGKHIIKAEQLIRDRNIPVIALSADQNRLNFGKNALFLSPSDPQPFYQIRYIKEVLKTNSVALISETDYLLHNRYDTLLRENNMERRLLIELSQKVYTSNNKVPEADSVRLVRRLAEVLPTLQDSVLLFNVHGGYGNVILSYLREHPLRGKAIVGLQQSAKLPEEVQADLTKLGSTFITLENDNEAFPLDVTKDWTTFEPKHKAAFKNDNARTLLWRMRDAINLIEAVWEKNPMADRAQTSNLFKSLSSRKLLAENELYDFDSSMILKKSPLFSQLYHGHLRLSPTQINSNGDSMPNLQVGVDILDINDINLRNNSFNCNLRYWVIAHPEHINKESFINFNTLIKADDSQKELISERIEDENVIRLYQVSGRFFNRYETSDFPLDWQEVVLPISALASSDELKISFDDSRLNQKDKLRAFGFNDWEPRAFYVTVDNQIANRLGSIERANLRDSTAGLEKYKNFNIHLVVKRQSWGAITLIILPFLMFSLLPIFMLFSVNLTFGNVGETIMSTFIAAVAYSINLVQISPTTDSLNRAYKLLLLTLAVNSICLLYVVFVDKKNANARNIDYVEQLRRIFPFVLMATYAAAFYAIFS